MSRTRSGAERVDRAFKELCKLREQYGFPELAHEHEANGNWHVSYSMPHNSVDRVRLLVKQIREAMGSVPWKYAPKTKE